MPQYGHVLQARAVREVVTDGSAAEWTSLWKNLHDLAGTIREVVHDKSKRGPRPQDPFEEERREVEHTPMRVQITKGVVQRFGHTDGCRGLMSEIQACQILLHSEDRGNRIVDRGSLGPPRRLVGELLFLDIQLSLPVKRWWIPGHPSQGSGRSTLGVRWQERNN